MRIAIVGNIASGKSEVEKIISSLNFPVLDTDKVAHKLLDNSIEIQDEFQNFDVFERNKVSREKLGKIVFSDKKMKKKLENILHPKIRVEINNFLNKNYNKMAFVSVPLLFEAGMEDLFDTIIFVYADDTIRLQRLITRNGYTRDYAIQRINSQQNQEEKIRKSDFVIYNDSTLEELNKNVAKILKQLQENHFPSDF
ncbi:dephospho-CoA kinase [bacterium]|nr:dephospho-CoA kinase [bacterium]